jgi:hypothetical protein
MSVTTEQRAVDLIYAGHSIAAVADITGASPNAIRGYLRDSTQSPSSSAGATPTVETLTPTSGTASQDATGQDSDIYASITGHAGGTVTVAIGPANSVADTIISAEDASLTHTVKFRLPAGWFYEITVAGSAAIGTVKQITA